MDNAYTFQVGDATITPIERVTNRARANFRRIRKLLIDNGADDDSAFEFAYITAYTKNVVGGVFRPSTGYPPDDVILREFELWQDMDAALTDQWIAGLFPAKVDVATAPEPLADDADPNSLPAAPLSKTA